MMMGESPTESGDTVQTAGMARMLALDHEEALWPDSDMADLLRHQLSAPVVAELRRFGAMDEATLAEIQGLDSGSTPATFGQMLLHSNPSLQLLRAIKDFGKFNAQQKGPLPSEIGYVLCYAAIIAALLRHDQRISAMDNLSIRQGAQWVTQQPWVDPATRELCLEGLAKLRRYEG